MLKLFKLISNWFTGQDEIGIYRDFLSHINHPNIRENIRRAESSREAAVFVVQDAIEVLSQGDMIGSILSVEVDKGLIIIKYKIMNIVGQVAYIPNSLYKSL
jgi:hypothetical protein